jgi:hypothetical protein
MRASISALALSFGTLLSSRAAWADAPRVLVATLEVQKDLGAERCIDEPALAQAVEERLARPVFDVRSPPDLVVQVRLTRPQPSEWRGDLRLLDVNGNELGRRELVTKAKDCSALDASLALVVALLVDAPPNMPPEPSPEPAPTTEPAAPPPPVPVRPTPAPTRLVVPENTFAPREPWDVALYAAATGLVGIAPRPLFGAALTLEVHPPRLFGLRASGEFLPKARVELDPDRGAELTLVRFGLAVCPLEKEAGPLRFEICAGQEVGWLGVTGFGFDENLESGELAYSVEGGGSAFLHLVAGLGLWISAAVEVPLVRNDYFSASEAISREDLYRAKPIAGNAQIGAGIEF